MARKMISGRDIKTGMFLGAHGMCGQPEYQAWANAIYRCENSNAPQWPDYGKRGIKVCDIWRMSFETFIEDMGERPTAGHSLDRVDVDGNYEPANCRWATAKEQANNRRNTRLVGGLSLRQLSEETGLPYSTITSRVQYGWSDHKIMNQPRREYRRKRHVNN